MKETVWEVFHGQDLDKLVDEAHNKLPLKFNYGDIHVTTQYLNDEYVVTVVATIEDDD